MMSIIHLFFRKTFPTPHVALAVGGGGWWKVVSNDGGTLQMLLRKLKNKRLLLLEKREKRRVLKWLVGSLVGSTNTWMDMRRHTIDCAYILSKMVSK